MGFDFKNLVMKRNKLQNKLIKCHYIQMKLKVKTNLTENY